MSIREGIYKVNFENLIEVLGKNLYTTPKAAIRELIQNANDSCIRRMVTDNYEPFIRVRTLTCEKQLVIEDNGAGMLEKEVDDFLSSLGSGKTSIERVRLKNTDEYAAGMLIGQFGIGFLSSFVVAEKVIVKTRSIDGADPVRWECEGKTGYRIGKGSRQEAGTEVILFLKGGYFDLLDEDIVREAIIWYADFISIPIFLNDSGLPINHMNAPWHYNATEKEYAQYIEHRYGIRPLALKPITIDRPNLFVSGILFIPPSSERFNRRLRSVDLFHTRMYVGEDLKMLPEWAGFVCAVLECPTLTLVASREAAIDAGEAGEPYMALQEYLGEIVTEFLKELANNDRYTFMEIISQHEWRVLRGALLNDQFFDEVKDLIPFPTDMGEMTIPKYLERVPPRLGGLKPIYYVTGKHQFSQQQSNLFKAQGVPILQADAIVEQFLRKYVRLVENIGLRQLASGVIDLMEFAGGERWRTLEARYLELGISARAAKFDPPELPVMAIKKGDYDESRLVDQMIDGSRSLLDFISHVGKETSDIYEVAFNVTNPIIARLADYAGDSVVINTALKAVYTSALLSAGVELSPDLSQSVANAQMRIIELLLEQADRIETGQTTGPYALSQFDIPMVAHAAEKSSIETERGKRLLDMATRRFESGDMKQSEALWLQATLIDGTTQRVAYTNLGTLYTMEEKFPLGRMMFDRAIDLAPEDPHAYLGLAELFEKKQEWEGAIFLRRAIAEKFSEYRSAALERVGDLLHRCVKDPIRAEEAYRKSLEAEPSRTGSIIGLAQLYEEIEKWDKAASRYKNLAEISPEQRVTAMVQSALCLSKSGHTVDAQSQLLHMRHEDPENPKILIGLASFYEGQQHFEDAVQSFMKVAAVSDENAPNAFANIALIRCRQERDEDAVLAFEEAIREAENSEGPGQEIMRLASKFLIAKHYDFAEKALLKAVHYDSQEKASACSALGGLYSGKGRYKEARDAFQKAIKINPDQIMFHIPLSQILEKLELWEEAAKTHQRIGQLSAEYRVAAKCKAAICLSKCGHYKEAESELIDMRERRSDDEDVLLALAQVYEHAEKWEDAIRAYEMITDIRHKRLVSHQGVVAVDRRIQAETLTCMGNLYKHYIQDFRQAEAAYKKALKADPRCVETLVALADLHERCGDLKRAITISRKLARISKVHRPAALAKAALFVSRMGQTVEAEERFDQLLEKYPKEVAILNCWATFLDEQNRIQEANDVKKHLVRLSLQLSSRSKKARAVEFSI